MSLRAAASRAQSCRNAPAVAAVHCAQGSMAAAARQDRPVPKKGTGTLYLDLDLDATP